MDTFAVITDPTPSLRERSAELDVAKITTPEFQEFVDKLTRTMFVEDGIGIAAPQVGQNIRVIIVNLKEGATCFINPEFTKKSEALMDSEEGCLSVPGKQGIVKRHKRVGVKALNRYGRRMEIEVSGLMSTVFQHEIDHLDGILYVDKAIKVFNQPKARNL